MIGGLIKNFDELATTPNRKIALEIMRSWAGCYQYEESY